MNRLLHFFAYLAYVLQSATATDPVSTPTPAAPSPAAAPPISDENYSKYRLSLLDISVEKKIGDLIIKREIYSNSIYGTYEVVRRENSMFKAYFAAIMKYSITGNIPLTKQHLLDWCSQIEHFNKVIKDTAISLTPCVNNTIFNSNTKSGEVSYVLFDKPNGGFRIEDACVPKSLMERVCLYSSKEFSAGIIKLLSQMSIVTTPSYFLIHLLKEAIYYGHPSLPDISDNKFILVPHLNFQTFGQIQTNSILSDDQKKSYSNSMMQNLGQFVFRMFTDLKNPIPIAPFFPGQVNTMSTDQMQLIDRVFLFFSEIINKNNPELLHEDKYFGLSLKFINSLKDVMNANQASSSSLKENLKQIKPESLNGSVFDFINKLINGTFEGTQAALDHPFLSTPTLIIDTESESAAMEVENH